MKSRLSRALSALSGLALAVGVSVNAGGNAIAAGEGTLEMTQTACELDAYGNQLAEITVTATGWDAYSGTVLRYYQDLGEPGEGLGSYIDAPFTSLLTHTYRVRYSQYDPSSSVYVTDSNGESLAWDYIDLDCAVPGSFKAIYPVRLLDTRQSGVVSAGGSVTVDFDWLLTGNGLTPSDVSAVVGNLTVTQPGAAGFATVYPTGTPEPIASNLNFRPGQNIPNLTTVRTGSNGTITIVNHSAALAHFIYDVFGFYRSGTPVDAGTFTALDPSRILDTRVNNGASGPVSAYGSVDLQVAGRGGVPASGVSAVVLNVTVTNPSAEGFVTVWPAGESMPVASNINFSRGDSLPAMVTVPLGADGRVSLANWANGTADLIADVAGYYLEGTPTVSGSFVSLSPTRVLDTRINFGDGIGVWGPNYETWMNNYSSNLTGPVPPNGGFVEFNVNGVAGVQSNGGSAYLFNSTVTAPQTGGFMTASDDPTSIGWSNLNFAPDQTIANATVIPGSPWSSSSEPWWTFYINHSAGSAHVIADIAGYFKW